MILEHWHVTEHQMSYGSTMKILVNVKLLSNVWRVGDSDAREAGHPILIRALFNLWSFKALSLWEGGEREQNRRETREGKDDE